LADISRRQAQNGVFPDFAYKPPYFFSIILINILERLNMNSMKYKQTIILFIAVVAVGVSITLSRFNHRVCPSIPVRAFGLEGAGTGAYQVEFLGEKIRLKLPVDLVMEFYDPKKLKESREYMVKNLVSIRCNVEEDLSRSLTKLNDVEADLTAELTTFACKMKEQIHLKKWFTPDKAGEME